MVSVRQSLLPDYNPLQLLDSYSVSLIVEIKPFNQESKDNNRRTMQSEQS